MPKESLRTRHNAILAIWFFGGLIFIFLSMSYSEFFLIPLLILLFIMGYLNYNLKCPNCDVPVLYKKIGIMGIEFRSFGGFVPEKCRNCGQRL